MRPLKFRAYSRQTGDMHYMNPADEGRGALYDLLENEAWKVMLFTGKHDDDGRPVYEGDVITNWEGIRRFVVEWDNEYACFVARKLDTDRVDLEMNEQCRVLGNIYENPELLVVESE